MATDAVIVYGPDPDEPEDPYTLVLISKPVWEVQGEWYSSYESEEFVELFEWVRSNFGLDVLAALEKDPRFERVADLYSGPEGS
jgi:hypothetical protein